MRDARATEPQMIRELKERHSGTRYLEAVVEGDGRPPAPAEDMTCDALQHRHAVPFVEIRGYLFGFFVSEPPNEPAHIHVKGKGGSAKLWLLPVRLVRSSYSATETREIVDIASGEEDRFVEMWRERFRDR